ncbi:MAG: cell division protein FtsZ, partial [Acidisphaera sp.]|nr:cell division protein FtsZ [Acidisphaera sp.]
ASNLQGVDFVVANTDAQQLMHSRADRRVQLGPHLTQGLGAGAKPEIGRAAAEEATEELARHLEGTHMVFITAGMGGGTGTGAAPVIARMARERGILTVGVVTKPFTFEGVRRARAADHGITELQQFVDTLIVIPNQNLFRLANERTGWKEAFKMADHVLYMGVRGVTDLMVAPGLVNLDFADIRTVMAEMGKAMMGTGEAEGENRAIRAAEAAISNPLLEDTSMAGARGLLINITGGEDMTLYEVDQAANRIREEVDEEANIIFGSAIDDALNGKVRVSVVATGIESAQARERPRLVAVAGGGGAPLSAVASGAGPAVVSAVPPSSDGRVGGEVQGMLGHPRPASRLQPGMPPALHAMGAPSGGKESLAGQPVPPMVLHPIARPQPGYGEREPVHADRGQVEQAEYADAEPGAAEAEPEARGLFADPAHAPASQKPAASSPQPRGSLFGIVTGAIRRTMPGTAPAGAVSEPVLHEPRPDPIRASVRPSSAEDMGLDIPAFLRRQSS